MNWCKFLIRTSLLASLVIGMAHGPSASQALGQVNEAVPGSLRNAELKAVCQWTISEIALTSTVDYAKASVDVTVDAIFELDDLRIKRPAFWDGGSIWKIRFAPPRTGAWVWRTTCSDQGNAGLHGQTGQIECTAYEGTNPNYRHGFVQASPNRRYFVRADGTPFFWLGDTHWQGPDRETVKACNHPTHMGKPCPHGGQFQHLAQDRKSKGFTVYQLYPSVRSRHWWTQPYDRISPERFQNEFDAMMDYLAAQGFVVAVGLGHWSAPGTVAKADLKRWARYIVARYGAHPVVWITAQEADMRQDVLDGWKAVANEIHRTDGYGHPLSYHQRWGVHTTWWKESWHDWACTQGGHRNVKLRSQSDYRSFWDYTPHKPWLESEHNYEAMTACGGPHSAAEVRHAAWKSMLCGSFGYTYGGSGVWLLGRNAEDLKSPWIDHVWSEGMKLPASTQVGHLKRFFTRLPWWKLEPRFGDPKWCRFTEAEKSVLATDDERLAVVYAYGEQPTLGSLCGLNAMTTYAVSWFDPRTGDYQLVPSLTTSDAGTLELPDKPDDRDWVLKLVRLEDKVGD